VQNKIKHLTLSGLLALAFAIHLTAQAAAPEVDMTVSMGKEVSIEYALSFEDRKVFESNAGGEPLKFVYGLHQIIPGLENAVEGMKVGDSKDVTVKPEDAYGPIDKDAFVEIKKELIPEEALAVGAQLQSRDANGITVNLLVAEIKEETVVLDANHPLAGKTLYFDVKILDIKDSVAEAVN